MSVRAFGRLPFWFHGLEAGRINVWLKVRDFQQHDRHPSASVKVPDTKIRECRSLLMFRIPLGQLRLYLWVLSIATAADPLTWAPEFYELLFKTIAAYQP